MTEQRYKAVLAVIAGGRTVSEVASEWGVCRQTMHRWLARYEGDGLEGLGNRSSRPGRCPHQTPPAVEAMVLEMRRAHAYWGARRIAFELARKGVQPAPSESATAHNAAPKSGGGTTAKTAPATAPPATAKPAGPAKPSQPKDLGF